MINRLSKDMLQKLFKAKCIDLNIQPNEIKEARFFEYCSKVIQNQHISLIEVDINY